MKALIWKDTYVIWRQMKYFLVMLLLFCFLPNGFNNAFAVIYAAMLPYTALAYDERSKWDQLAATMPYSTRDMVLSKYVFGWLCIVGAAALSGLLQIAASFVTHRTFLPGVLALSALGAVCILAITLPLMFRFGVERGRLAMFLVIFLVCGAAGAIAQIAEEMSGGALSILSGSMVAVALLVAAVLTVASVPLSIGFYGRRQR